MNIYSRKYSIVKRLAVLLAAAVYTLSICGCGAKVPELADESEASQVFSSESINTAEPDPSSPIARGDADNGEYTLMIYICAGDLESDHGLATSDINEIVYSDINEKLNIVIQTGGTREWKNSVISGDGQVQRFIADSSGLSCIDDSVGTQSMTDPQTLSDFISFCRKSYPAERYGLLLWDHGGGAVYGYGYDEYNPIDTITLADFDRVFSETDTAFEFIAFDACLMGSAETLITMSRYADYLFAAETSIYRSGLEYTGWITQLSDDLSASTKEWGKRLVSESIKEAVKTSPSLQTTLTLFDLSIVRSSVTPAFEDFMRSCSEMISSGGINEFTAARGRLEDIEDGFEHIDLISLTDRLGTPESASLAKALKKSVVISKNSISSTGYNGIGLYLPLTDISDVENMLEINAAVGFCESYDGFMRRYANALLRRIKSNAPSPHSDPDKNDFNPEWFSEADGEELDAMLNYLLAGDTLYLTINDDGDYVLELTTEELSAVSDCLRCLYFYSDRGIIEYGYDDYVNFDGNGNIIVGFSGSWMSLNGMIVPYYIESIEYEEGFYRSEGSIPCTINGKSFSLIAVCEESNGYSMVYISGARPENNSVMAQRELYELQNGDEITVMCWMDSDDSGELVYTEYAEPFIYDGNLSAYYTYDIPAGEYEICCELTDIYGSVYYTESVYTYAGY